MIRRNLLEKLDLNKDSCIYSFLRMMRTYSMFVREAVKENADVNVQRMGMLLMLRAEGDGMSQAEIAEELCVKPSSVTSMLNNMEKEGLIVRRSDNEDKRIKRTYLTETGVKGGDDVFEYIIGLSNYLFLDFTDKEQMNFKDLMSKMENNMLAKLKNAEKI